jgi:hypothetical protein
MSVYFTPIALCSCVKRERWPTRGEGSLGTTAGGQLVREGIWQEEAIGKECEEEQCCWNMQGPS